VAGSTPRCPRQNQSRGPYQVRNRRSPGPGRTRTGAEPAEPALKPGPGRTKSRGRAVPGAGPYQNRGGTGVETRAGPYQGPGSGRTKSRGRAVPGAGPGRTKTRAGPYQGPGSKPGLGPSEPPPSEPRNQRLPECRSHGVQVMLTVTATMTEKSEILVARAPNRGLLTAANPSFPHDPQAQGSRWHSL